jgi:hypothetical protein
MKGLVLLGIILILSSSSGICEDTAMLMGVPNMPLITPRPKRLVNKEKMVEESEAYFLEQIVTSTFVDRNSSLLTDEEKEELTSFGTDTSFQDDLIKKELARALAKQDVLKFKKLFKRQLGEGKTAEKRREH